MKSTAQIAGNNLAGKIFYNLKGIISIIRGDIIHNTFGAYHVLRLWHVQKIKAGLFTKDHPWCTGINPETNEPIWTQNIVFSTAPLAEAAAEADSKIMQKVGSFLAD